jgi:hypothetical protein
VSKHRTSSSPGIYLRTQNTRKDSAGLAGRQRQTPDLTHNTRQTERTKIRKDNQYDVILLREKNKIIDSVTFTDQSHSLDVAQI